jgi:hypothetical protein
MHRTVHETLGRLLTLLTLIHNNTYPLTTFISSVSLELVNFKLQKVHMYVSASWDVGFIGNNCSRTVAQYKHGTVDTAYTVCMCGCYFESKAKFCRHKSNKLQMITYYHTIDGLWALSSHWSNSSGNGLLW